MEWSSKHSFEKNNHHSAFMAFTLHPFFGTHLVGLLFRQLPGLIGQESQATSAHAKPEVESMVEMGKGKIFLPEEWYKKWMISTCLPFLDHKNYIEILLIQDPDPERFQLACLVHL